MTTSRIDPIEYEPSIELRRFEVKSRHSSTCILDVVWSHPNLKLPEVRQVEWAVTYNGSNRPR